MKPYGVYLPEQYVCHNGQTSFDCVGINTRQGVIINADTLKLQQNSIGITIDVSNETLSNIEIIEINGFKFTKESCV